MEDNESFEPRPGPLQRPEQGLPQEILDINTVRGWRFRSVVRELGRRFLVLDDGDQDEQRAIQRKGGESVHSHDND